MGLFGQQHHREREGIPVHHRVAKELLAAFVAAGIDRHFGTGRYRHLSRREARRMAHEQAQWLWLHAVIQAATGWQD